MKRSLVLILMIIGIIFPNSPASYSAGYANCVSVSRAEVTKEYGESVYVLQLKDVCDPGIRNYSLTLLSNNYSVPSVTISYVILSGYTKAVSFSLKGYTPGSYRPSLQISSNQDFEKSNISLPGFTIQAPLECIRVNSSGLDSGNQLHNYSISLQNTCTELDSFEFSNLSLQLMGVISAQVAPQKITNLSNFGTNFNFNLYGIAPGSYFPTLYIKDNWNSGSKVFPLSSFVIQDSNSGPVTNSSGKQVCISGKEYSVECFDFPEWTYEICSSNQSGKVQIQSGTSWIFGWNFKGVKDLDRCYAAHPFLITINGTSTRSSNLRLAFAKYQSKVAFYSNFKVTVR